MAYVYRHIRLDKNEPFYIGIGKTKYRANSKQRRNDIWNKIASKTNFLVEILIDEISWEEASIKEIEFIKLYGRIDKGTGTLANMTDGGDGNLGLVHSAEAIKKISEASKNRKGYWGGKKIPKEYIEKTKITKSQKVYPKRKPPPFTDKARMLLIERNKTLKQHLGKKHSDETKKKLSEFRLGKPYCHKGKENPNLKGEKNGMYGKKHTVESKKKNSDSQKKVPVAKYSLDNVLIEEYFSISYAATKNNIFATGIQANCKNRTKTYKGFIWKYKNNEQ